MANAWLHSSKRSVAKPSCHLGPAVSETSRLFALDGKSRRHVAGTFVLPSDARPHRPHIGHSRPGASLARHACIPNWRKGSQVSNAVSQKIDVDDSARRLQMVAGR